MLKLPGYQQLSKEQDAINNLSLTGSHLIVGPPGTGKTVLAIYRASMLKQKGKKVHFIVFSRALNQYLEQAMKETGIDALSTTFHSWFYKWYRGNFRSKVPEKKRYEFEWMEIYTKLMSANKTFEQYDHLIIDEGQDLPKEAYLVMRQIATDITVFADENQKITESNSTLKEIQTCLGVRDIHFLKKNYRNTRPIAEFARVFYAGLRSGMPDLPEKKGPKPRVIAALDLESQLEFIARYERNNKLKEIAVFVATNQQQLEIYKMLGQYELHNKVQMYIGKSSSYRKLDFKRSGIKILTYASAKGLEFDAVFIPALDTRMSEPDSELEKMRFYVMSSRAREDLFLLFSGVMLPPLLKIVPSSLYDREYII